MKPGNQPHILNASSNLLGICLIIVTGLHISKLSSHTFADEFSFVAAIMFTASCLFSYFSLRNNKDDANQTDFSEIIADYLFLGGIILLLVTITYLALING